MLHENLQKSLNDAFVLAHEREHDLVTPEHLLLSLLSNIEAVHVLERQDVNLKQLADDLEAFLRTILPKSKGHPEISVQPSLSFQRVIQRAIYQVQGSGQNEVNAINVLISLYAEPDSHALYFLEKQGVDRLSLVMWLTHDTDERGDQWNTDDDNTEDEEVASSVLGKYTSNLNELAMAGHIDPLIGRTQELERCAQILCRRRKNNPILVGDPGVGKTAIAEGLALKIVQGEVPDQLLNAEVYSLDLGALVAGTKYRGDFEKRLNRIISGLNEVDHAVLFIDEIHMLIGTGATSGNSMDASNLIKPLLANGTLRCIGATTYEEFREVFQQDKALARRFQQIDINEPIEQQTLEIIKGLKPSLEKHHNVKYTHQALERAVHLSYRHIHFNKAPDKTIDVLDEAGARQQLINRQNHSINANDIEAIIAQMCKVPIEKMSKTQRTTVKNLSRNLKRVIFGQDTAVETITNAIKLTKAGLRDENRPLGSFLFVGPTGVGKTELCRQLSLNMGIDLVRFDMSEYMEPHTASRLIGSPPGYVGFNKGGLLTEALNRQPHAVVLFDEIEKAHPDLFNIFLQVMDYGSLTDNSGRTANFKDAIIIMTSNIGTEHAQRSSLGFVDQDHSHDVSKAIQRYFSPEFRNRLDAVVMFSALQNEQILQVVDKTLFELEERLAKQNVRLDVADTARKWIAEKGYDKDMGARPLKRFIQDHIASPLANELLFGCLKKGGLARVTLKNDMLSFDTIPKAAKKRTATA